VALSATASVPVTVLATVGVKVTLIVQLAPAATLEPQLFVWANGAAALMLVMVSAEPPVLRSVTACAALVPPTVWLGKVKEIGERLAVAAAAAPVPVRLTVWGVLDALSLIVSVPVRLPAAVGLKVTLMVQVPLAATELPHVSVSAKSPLTAILVIARLTVPPLVRVIALAVLVVPTAWLAKASEVGDTVAELVTPVPERAAVWGLLVPLSVTVTAAVRAPVAVGLKVTLMVHWAPAAKLVPQPFVWAKSALLVPVMAMPLTLTDEAVPFFRVSACAVLVAPTD
jgi:hypothetical protein